MLWEATLPSRSCCDVLLRARGLAQSGFLNLCIVFILKASKLQFFPFYMYQRLDSSILGDFKSYGLSLYLSTNLCMKKFIYKCLCVRCVMCMNGYLCIYVIQCMKIIFKMNFKYEQDTNPRQNFRVNQLLYLNVSGCDGKKDVQKNFPKAELFGMYKEVGGFKQCRLDLTDVQLTPNIGNP